MRKPNAGIIFLLLALAAPRAKAAVTISLHGSDVAPAADSPLSSPAGKTPAGSSSTKLSTKDSNNDRTAGIRFETFLNHHLCLS